MRVGVVMNAGARAIRETERRNLDKINGLFRRHGLEVDVRIVAEENLIETGRQCLEKNPEILVAGGGDGTISSLAQIVFESGLILGVLPLGTMNHFARHLRIPLDWEKAIAALAQGQIRFIDVGEVNGRIFVNNSSIGIYPLALTERNPAGKPLSTMISVLKMFRKFPLHEVKVSINGQAFVRTTPFLFVGNNFYQVDLVRGVWRPSLEEGQLCLYTAVCRRRLCLARLFFLSLFNRLHGAKCFEFWTGTEMELHLPKSRKVMTAKDGEVLELETPLRYRTRTKSLRVLVPSSHTD